MANTFDETTGNAMLELIETRMKVGSAHTNPRICWYDGEVLLAQADLSPSDPFATASGKQIVLGPLADSTAWTAASITPGAAGTVDNVQLQNLDYTAILTITDDEDNPTAMGFADEASKVLTTATPLTFSAAPSWSI